MQSKGQPEGMETGTGTGTVSGTVSSTVPGPVDEAAALAPRKSTCQAIKLSHSTRTTRIKYIKDN